MAGTRRTRSRVAARTPRTELRWRSGSGAHWRPGAARSVDRVSSAGEGRFVVEAVDRETGAIRTFDTGAGAVEVELRDQSGRWVSVSAWANGTLALFDAPPA